LKLLIKGDHEKQEIKVDIDTQKKNIGDTRHYEQALKYNGDLVLIYETSPDGEPSEYKRRRFYRIPSSQTLAGVRERKGYRKSN